MYVTSRTISRPGYHGLGLGYTGLREALHIAWCIHKSEYGIETPRLGATVEIGHDCGLMFAVALWSNTLVIQFFGIQDIDLKSLETQIETS